MDIRYLIVGAPFIIAFFYSLFWLERWGAFDSSIDNRIKKMTMKNKQSGGDLITENMFQTKN
jgi:hypothetical protein